MKTEKQRLEEFLELNPIIIYSGGHPFNLFIKGMFERIIDGIENRDPELFGGEARHLKVVCEIFIHSNLDKLICVDIQLRRRLDHVVNFCRWLGYNGQFHQYIRQEYYLTEALLEELKKYTLLVKDYLIDPISDLINFDLQDDRANAFDTLIEKKADNFDYRKLITKIDKDFNKTKTIKEIAMRRNPNIKWSKGNIKNTYEEEYKTYLDSKNIIYEHDIDIGNPSKIPQSEFDFLISDGRNTLESIEIKSGEKARKTNDLILFSKKNNHLNITHSKFIGFRESWDKTSIHNMNSVAKLLNIQFEERTIQ